MTKTKAAHWEVWRTWDWSRQDFELADEHGISRERVRQIRTEFGFPASARYRCHRDSGELRFQAAFGDERPPLTAMAVAELLGIGTSWACQLMKRFGMPNVDPQALYDWDAQDWRKPTRVIAAETGATRVTVSAERRRGNRGPSAEPWGAWNRKKQFTEAAPGVVA